MTMFDGFSRTLIFALFLDDKSGFFVYLLKNSGYFRNNITIIGRNFSTAIEENFPV